jgi:O-acetyl-ADP-ribose deacetylase (regulator of RNase III)
MIELLRARLIDITTLTVDAIVNAANPELAPGGGVCGAIHQAAGPELALACRVAGPCPTGEARITPGFRLPARFVIHAVGPIWYGGTNREAEQLASAYRSALQLAKANQLETLAFPAISTGIFGYPLDLATDTAVATVRAELRQPGGITQVVFACFSPAALASYERLGVAV